MKNKIEIYICDDNGDFIEKIEDEIKSILSRQGREYHTAKFDSGRKLIDKCRSGFPDVVFLDIEMPGMTGFEIAGELQKIRENVRIVFITDHEDKVYQSWEFQPFWFLRKSHTEELEKVLCRLLRKIDSEYEKIQHTVTLTAETRVIEIDINNAVLLTSYKHDIVVNNNIGENIQVRCKMSEAEKQLKDWFFIRIQSGAIVNCRFISKITSREVILLNGEKIHISRDRLECVKNEFQRFVRSR